MLENKYVKVSVLIQKIFFQIKLLFNLFKNGHLCKTTEIKGQKMPLECK